MLQDNLCAWVNFVFVFWLLSKKYFSLFFFVELFHLFEAVYFSYCMSIRCGVVCVRLSSLFALRWCGTQGVSVLFSQLDVFLLSSSFFYSCSLIYHSSISTDMGNKGVAGPTCLHDCYDFACILVVDPESYCLCICLLVFVPCLYSSVFYSCFLIYPSSISSDMGNKGVPKPTCLHDFYDSVCIQVGS